MLFRSLIVLSSIMKVGLNDIVHYDDALIIAIRDTTPKFLELVARLDILFLTVGFAGLFMGIAIMLTAATEIVCRVLKRASRPAVVAILGVVTLISSLLTGGTRAFTEAGTEIKTLAGIALSMVVPLVLLIIAAIKKPKVKEKKNAA